MRHQSLLTDSVVVQLEFALNVYVYKFLLALVQFLHEHVVEGMVILDRRVDLDEAEDNALPDVSVGVLHQVGEHLSQGGDVAIEGGSVDALTLCFDLLQVLEFVGDHPEHSLQSGWLLCA